MILPGCLDRHVLSVSKGERSTIFYRFNKAKFMTHKPTPSKAETTLMPPFKALTLEQIFIPDTQQALSSANAEIFAAGVAGFDTESKPTFNRGEVSEGPHVVQFAIQDKAFIFQLNRPECLPYIAEILQSEAVLKVGFGLQSDHAQIHHKMGVKLAAVLDMNHVFRKEGYGSSTGVRAAVGLAMQQKFHKSKRVTTSNWAAAQLNDKQLLYAANDAYAALEVLNALDWRREDLPIRWQIPVSEQEAADA